MKKFFTVISNQPEGRLNKQVYQAKGNKDLQMDMEVSFPILTAVNAYVRPGESFRLIAVMHKDSKNEIRNKGILERELQTLCEAKGVICPAGAEIVEIESDEMVSTHAETFQKLLKYADNEDELYVCMTYGTKPLSTAVVMVAQYAYRVKRNTLLSCVVYGGMDHETGKGVVYDVTALIQLNEIVHTLAEQKIQNPEKMIEMILSL